MATMAATCGTFNLRQTILPVPKVRPMSNIGTTSLTTAAATRSSKALGQKRREVTVSAVVDDRVELDDNPEGIISGEWTENFSLICYDDLRAYFEPKIFKNHLSPATLLGEVMSSSNRAATADQTLEEIDHHFLAVSGLPVIDDELRCIGIITKKDTVSATHGMQSKVGEVMTSPPITLSPQKTVLDAAGLLLKMDAQSIAIVNEDNKVIGIISRRDILQELEVVESHEIMT